MKFFFVLIHFTLKLWSELPRFWNFDQNSNVPEISFLLFIRTDAVKELDVTDIQFGAQLCDSLFHSFLQHLGPQNWVPNSTYYVHILNCSSIHRIARVSSYYTKVLCPLNEISAADTRLSLNGTKTPNVLKALRLFHVWRPRLKLMWCGK